MDIIKLLIIDSDTHFIDLVSRFIKNYPDIEMVGFAALKSSA